MDEYDLGLLVSEVDGTSVNDFDGRMRLQKTVLLLQSFGIDLGYHYLWLVNGPYCMNLGEDCLALKGILPKIRNIGIPVDFEHGEDQASYDGFRGFMRDHGNDPDSLAIASTMCFLHREGMYRETVLRLTAGMRDSFDMDMCRRMWDILKGHGAVGFGADCRRLHKAAPARAAAAHK